MKKEKFRKILLEAALGEMSLKSWDIWKKGWIGWLERLIYKLGLKKIMVVLIEDDSGSTAIDISFKALLYLIEEDLRQYYGRGLKMIYIRHDFNASVVDRTEFYSNRCGGGGTRISPALAELKEILSSTEAYVFQFTDGYNWPEDNQRCALLMREILPKIGQYYVCLMLVDPMLTDGTGREYLQSLISEISEEERIKKVKWVGIPWRPLE